MYRILLVDDEKMELEALKNYIDWKTLGIDHVDTAKNGKAAYELVLDRQPDIVITDIQMIWRKRFMSGTGILRSSF